MRVKGLREITDSSDSRTYNVCDVLLFCLVASTLFGYLGYSLLTPTRMLIVIFTPFAVRFLNRESIVFLRSFLLFFSLWFTYDILSLLWVPDMKYALHDTFLFMMNSLLFVEILIFAQNAISPLKSISYAWMFAFFVTAMVAIRELLFNVHLSNARVEDTIRTNEFGDSIDFIYAAASFYNYNTYCLYICFCFLFVIYLLSTDFGIRKFFFCLLQMLLSVVILAINGSRGAIISVAVVFLVYLCYSLRKKKKGAKWVLFSILSLFSFIFYKYGDMLLEVIMFRLEQKDMFEDNARVELWMASFGAFIDSMGFGTGVGSMIPVLQSSRTLTLGIYYCHSLFLELLMEYGIIIFLCFIGFLLKMFLRARCCKDSSRKMILYAFFLSMPTFSVINSEYVAITFVWCFFASIFVFSSNNCCCRGEVI